MPPWHPPYTRVGPELSRATWGRGAPGVPTGGVLFDATEAVASTTPSGAALDQGTVTPAFNQSRWVAALDDGSGVVVVAWMQKGSPSSSGGDVLVRVRVGGAWEWLDLYALGVLSSREVYGSPAVAAVGSRVLFAVRIGRSGDAVKTLVAFELERDAGTGAWSVVMGPVTSASTVSADVPSVCYLGGVEPGVAFVGTAVGTATKKTTPPADVYLWLPAAGDVLQVTDAAGAPDGGYAYLVAVESDADRVWLAWSWYQGERVTDGAETRLGWFALDSSGAPNPASSFEQTIAGWATPAWDPGLAIVPDGTVLVGWQEQTATPGIYAVHLGRFDSSGVGASAEVSDFSASNRRIAFFPSIVADEDTALVVWEGKSPNFAPPADVDGAVGRMAAVGSAPLTTADYDRFYASDKTRNQTLTWPGLWRGADGSVHLVWLETNDAKDDKLDGVAGTCVVRYAQGRLG